LVGLLRQASSQLQWPHIGRANMVAGFRGNRREGEA
jgi:hypothetical protein